MCGIFGTVAQTAKKFNKRAFCVLGCDNDSRGGDSCGIFIDGEVEYGIDKEKYFINFFRDSVLLNTVEHCKIAFGHCRKASVGKISLETAQPVVLKNEQDEVEFVLIHNGTIHNYEELAKKYIPDIDITGLTDSQVMARIFYHKGYDCLDEYNGGAVFVIHDYRTEQTLVFKGSSKKTEYVKEATEERPLYYCWHNDRFIFSSIYETLYAYFYEYPVYMFPVNKLIKIKKNKLKVIAEYTREKCQQNKPYKSTYTGKTHTVYSDYDWDDIWLPSNEGYLIKYDAKKGYLDNKKQPLHGVYSVASYGWIYPKGQGKGVTYSVAFYNGRMLKHHQAFDLLNNNTINKTLTPKGAHLLSMMDYNPFSSDGKQFYWYNENQLMYPNGFWKLPFADITYTFNNKGILLKSEKGYYPGWVEDYQKYVYNENEILKWLEG